MEYGERRDAEYLRTPAAALAAAARPPTPAPVSANPVHSERRNTSAHLSPQHTHTAPTSGTLEQSLQQSPKATDTTHLPQSRYPQTTRKLARRAHQRRPTSSDSNTHQQWRRREHIEERGFKSSLSVQTSDPNIHTTPTLSRFTDTEPTWPRPQDIHTQLASSSRACPALPTRTSRTIRPATRTPAA